VITVAFHFLWPKRRIPISEVRKAVATKYRPFLDYGGYGVRLGFRGWAFNVSGDEGVLVETNDGSRLMDRLAASEGAREGDRASTRRAGAADSWRGTALTHLATERDAKGSIPLRLVFGP